MKKYFGYIRVSTAKQGEHGVSLQEQREAILRCAQQAELTISEWYEERETAAKRGRPVFNDMLQHLRRGEALGVVIHKIDRSARNLRDWADLGELIDQGINVVFANESLDLQTRGGRLSADIQAVVAADYIRNLREESRKGIYGRLKQGLYPFPAPVGYLNQGEGKAKIPDPISAPLVRKTFELYGTGQHGTIRLAQIVYSLGLRNRRGKRVSANGISTILRNPFYIGLIQIGSTKKIYRGIHPPIVSKALYDRVQRILDGKNIATVQRHDFVFRRLVTCRHCGYSLIGEKQKGHTYYRCHTKDCPTMGIREDVLDQHVLTLFNQIRFGDVENKCLEALLATFNLEWMEQQQVRRQSIEMRLSQASERLNRLTDAYLDGMIENNIFDARKRALLLEIKELEEAQTKNDKGEDTLPDKIRKIIERANSAYFTYLNGNSDEKRDLLNIVTSNRYIDGKNISINLNIPFNEIANHRYPEYGGPYRSRPRTDMATLLKKLIQRYSEDKC
jgi:site-specific DNA recombinase